MTTVNHFAKVDGVMSRFKQFWRELGESRRNGEEFSKSQKRYAKRAGTTANYIDKMLIYVSRTPRRPLMQSLVDASNGELSMSDILDHFYPDDDEAA